MVTFGHPETGYYKLQSGWKDRLHHTHTTTEALAVVRSVVAAMLERTGGGRQKTGDSGSGGHVRAVAAAMPGSHGRRHTSQPSALGAY